MQAVCLIDISGYIYRAFYALPPMSKKDGTPVGAVYGLCRMLRVLLQENQADAMVAVFDSSRQTFRQQIFADYKQNRAAVPPELVAQFPMVREAVRAFGLPVLECSGFEADDIIATCALQLKNKGVQVKIISADKDLMQLVSEGVCLYDPMKKRDVGPAQVREKFGVSPEQVVQVQALMGDSSDNIPGAKGIGPKTASDLIARFGTLENLYAHLTQLTPRQQELLSSSKDNVFISRDLATLRTDVPVDVDISSWRRHDIPVDMLRDFLEKNEFKTAPFLGDKAPIETSQKTTALKTLKDLQTWVGRLNKTLPVALFYDENGLGVYQKTAAFMAFAPQQRDLFNLSDNNAHEDVFRTLRPLFADKSITKIVYDAKAWYHKVQIEKPPENIKDVMILDFLSCGGRGTYTPQAFLQGLPQDCLAAQGAKKLQAVYADLQDTLSPALWAWYEKTEEKIIFLLYQMECNGVLIDKDALGTLQQSFQSDLQQLEQQIYTQAGQTFNINSAAQLGHILFDKMHLPGGKKGASGAWITDKEVLDALVVQTPLAQSVLDYRQKAKLLNTYIVPFLKETAGTEKRIHTTFSMVNTNTGRLASFNPNLQNIPARTADGRAIRHTFTAEAGHVLLWADYSQIELRLLAHVANVQGLKQAFAEQQDIHALTAAQVFHVPLAQVTGDLRRRAKAINFGIIYGMSAFGLAKTLDVPVSQAQSYINAYFSRFPEILAYQKQMIEQAKRTGAVYTLAGRACLVEGLANPRTAAAAQRVAINAPIQGGAADIIKLAMIKADEALQQQKIAALALLQVHDELVFEVPASVAEKAQEVIKDSMQNCIALSVPLEVNVAFGPHWEH